jgi:hypothetical protein
MALSSPPEGGRERYGDHSVVDLKRGVVVRARMGQRDQYRPIETPLSPTMIP